MAEDLQELTLDDRKTLEAVVAERFLSRTSNALLFKFKLGLITWNSIVCSVRSFKSTTELPASYFIVRIHRDNLIEINGEGYMTAVKE